MSVDQLPPGRASAPQRGAQLVRYDEFIDKQIESTRRMVKTVDVMTALLTMAVGTLGFLLAAAIIEHWLVPGGYNLGVRLLLFVALVGGLLLFAARRLWPLVAGSINPAYAAHTIEQDNPSLKNSLLNLLLFRQHRDDVTDAVYETLEEQAARRLTRVPVDAAVDRTHLLRLGYVLVAIVAAVALYKIFSPKDPFITAERVLMPWAPIVPPSRVSIENVEPGAVTLARGEVLTISADVRGIGDDDPVVIKYTTADGQAVDRPAPMTPSSVGLRFTGQLPPASDGTQAGVAQNLRYHIEAGDARSLEYAVTVVAAPTIMVERIEYDYPEYTGFVDRSVERLGDIRAIEGTRVTIHARANGPIEEAAVDFEADGRRDLRMEATGSDARATFSLELRDDRRTPRYTSYVLRFTGSDGRPNRDPVKFPIDVTPDRAPEVSITAPAEKSRDVRLDETVAIEVDAIDSDFALADVRLHGESAGKPVLDEKLLTQEHTGRFRGRLLFTPLEHNLKPGDVVRYWVTARDNRTPGANETSSDSQTLRILGGDPRNQNQQKPNQNGESQEGQQQPGAGGQSGAQGSDSSAGSEQGQSSAEESSNQSGEGESSQGQGESASADGNSDQQGKQNSENRSGQSKSGERSNNGDSSSNENGSSDSNTGDQSTGEGQSRSQGQNQSGSQQRQPGESSETGESGERSDQNQSQQPGGSNSRGNQNPAADSQSQPRENEQPGRQDGEQREGNSSQQSGERQPSAGREPKSDADTSPVSSEGDNDGEAFERIRDFLNREGQLPKESEEESAEPQSEPGEQSQGESGESASADGQNATDSENAKPNQPSDTKPDPAKNPDANSNAEPQPGDSTDQSGDESQPSGDQQSPDGQRTSSEGESGTGQEPKAGQGSPESQQPGEQPGKWQQKPSGDKSGDGQDNEQEAPSGGRGDRKNDSQGNEGGDRSGGGEEGAGQKSERDGTGSSGQNQSADEGAGESSEQGAGENSSNAGEDAKSNERTGQPGSDEPGAGLSSQEGQGEQPGGAEQGEPASAPGEPASAGGNQPADSKSDNKNQSTESPADSPESPNGEQQQQPGTQPGNSNRGDGAGKVPEGVIPPSGSSGTAPDADAANLDYARKQTDLVLETLDEQMKRQKVDKRLLDKLGWTEADLKRFLDRWRQLKEAAAQEENPVAEEAQRELDDALRSLGLRRGELQQQKVSDDTNRDLSQGFRGPIPLEYQERLRAYNQGVSRAQQSDE